jgi:hypothetical protein
MLKNVSTFESTPVELEILLAKDDKAKRFLKAYQNPTNKGIAIWLSLPKMRIHGM